MTQKRIRLSPVRIIALGFLAMILIGAGLLMLPVSSRSRESLGFFDALFTATSACCVTGLVVVDTWTRFSLFGQVVLLVLIQIGGLGFMSVATLFSLALGKRIGLRERSLLMESVSSLHIGGVVLLLRRVLIGTAVFEGAGAVLLAFRFCPSLGLARGLWYGVFHAVSAFCNAGFDLMGRFEPFSSLMRFQSDVYVNVIIMLLILLGGTGFVVWQDVLVNKLHFSRYMLHTKIMLSASVILVLLPAAVFFITERDASMSGMGVGERVLASLFQSVTARTAGFNTVDLAKLNGGSTILFCLIMTIGAGAGSTGGGIKVTTFVMIALYVAAFCRGRSDAQIFGRRLDEAQLRRAFCATAFFVGLAIFGCFVLLAVQPLEVQAVLLEVFSATGTVGVSAGITRSLAPVSRAVLILLMYCGRMGSITLAMAVAEKKSNAKIQKPVEKIIVG